MKRYGVFHRSDFSCDTISCKIVENVVIIFQLEIVSAVNDFVENTNIVRFLADITIPRSFRSSRNGFFQNIYSYSYVAISEKTK